MTEDATKDSLFKVISKDSTPEQFESAVSDLLSTESSLQATEVGEGLLYMSAFAPDPATFDIEAVGEMTIFSGEKLDHFVQTAISLGVIKNAPKEGRLMIGIDRQETLSSILDKYPK